MEKFLIAGPSVCDRHQRQHFLVPLHGRIQHTLHRVPFQAKQQVPRRTLVACTLPAVLACGARHKRKTRSFATASRDSAGSLKQVLVVHRHGARFPTKPAGPRDLSWPVQSQFWESNKGHLTPVGHKLLHDIGRAFRDHYYLATSLFEGAPKIDGHTAVCYTSNVQRTLQSAWSFLLGFLRKSAPIFFSFRSDRIASEREQGRVDACTSMGVPIYIEDSLQDDKLFHEWELHDDYAEWRVQNLHKSPVLRELAANPKHVQLLDKIYRATGLKSLAPQHDSLERIIAAKDVDTLVMIEKAHNLPILPNAAGISLGEEDLACLAQVGLEVKRCWFEEAASSSLKNSFGSRGAGYLAHKLWRHMDERLQGKSNLRFVEFSCHDTTLAAFANCLGVRLPDIGFGAHFIFELHRPRVAEPYVKVLYNPLPAVDPKVANLSPHVLPLSEHVVEASDWHSLPVGNTLLADLRRHCEIPGLEESFQKLLQLVAERQHVPTRERLLELLAQGAGSWLTLEQWRERYLPRFEVADKNGDGRLDQHEISLMLDSWGHNSSPCVFKMLWELFDLESHETVTDVDFYHMMVTLMGMRGSISTWDSADLNQLLLPTEARAGRHVNKPI
mmetsp:Transcript_27964/g.61688  ORF Transcript_27964/g.61688 Transcript_27964/m.61688 type:complete len:614 (-) Transcript_27964:26-1867(-)